MKLVYTSQEHFCRRCGELIGSEEICFKCEQMWIHLYHKEIASDVFDLIQKGIIFREGKPDSEETELKSINCIVACTRCGFYIDGKDWHVDGDIGECGSCGGPTKYSREGQVMRYCKHCDGTEPEECGDCLVCGGCGDECPECHGQLRYISKMLIKQWARHDDFGYPKDTPTVLPTVSTFDS